MCASILKTDVMDETDFSSLRFETYERAGEQSSTLHKVKAKKKNFMMVKHKLKAKSKRSFAEKARDLKQAMKRSRKFK